MKISTNALTLALTLAGSFVANADQLPPLHVHHASVHGNSGNSAPLPPNHPPVPKGHHHHHDNSKPLTLHPTLARFSSQFRCPYAKEWLTKGAHKAAIDLGLTTPEKIASAKKSGYHHHHNPERNRRLQETDSIQGSCTFNNQWTGPSCLEFRGEGWTEASMTERCGAESDSTLSLGVECPRPEELAGWCLKEAGDNAVEATSMMVSAMSDCDGNKMACESFVGGAFVTDGGCATTDAAATMTGSGAAMDYSSMGPPSGGQSTCMIAPGAIGAAHQSGFSQGYSNTCAGTPAEGSPYMWPLAWSANVDTQNLAYGYDEVVFHTKGRTFYRLDKNWKRSDTTFSKGVRRGLGQGPCENIDEEQSVEGVIACIADMDVDRGDPMETMIHKGSKMYFITWKNSTEVEVGATDPSLIAECNHMDLAVIGNIRPDWFLDDMGDDTDVQYLGDQHVYYASTVPRLVKQWRKKDFASQYFTMSVAGNPPTQNATETESIRWPLVLNIPGEGFGDDMLQFYQNHELLTDDNDNLFELVDNLEASGGSCPLITSMGGDGDGEATFGPPQLEVHVPSNLEVDENSWMTNVYTFSPVWQPPLRVDATPSGTKDGVAVTETDRVTIESCYDPASKQVKLSFEFLDIASVNTAEGSKLPWLSIGYREEERCAMTPVGGGDTKMVMVMQSPEDNYPKAYAASMGPATKSFKPEAFNSIYESFWPLEEAIGYSSVGLSAPMLSGGGAGAQQAVMSRSATVPASSVVLSFGQEFDTKPDVMYLMYAIGASSTLGMHTSRSCFEITDFPTCSAESSMDSTTGDDLMGAPSTPVKEASATSATTPVSSGSALTTVFGAAVAVLFASLACFL